MKTVIRICFMCLIDFITFISCVIKEGNNSTLENLQNRQFSPYDLLKKNVRIDFFGKLLDQENKPVKRAAVSIVIHRYDILPPNYFNRKEFKVYSNQNGEFSVNNELGNRLMISEIDCEGYEKLPNKETSSLEYYIKNGLIYHNQFNPTIPSIYCPHVYYVRKIGEVSYLGTGIMKIHFKKNESGQEKGWDFIGGTGLDEKEMSTRLINGEAIYPDIICKALLDVKKASWSVRLSVEDGEGIIITDRLLYEAPKDGYKKTLEFNSDEILKNPIRYLYVSSRKRSIYTRVDFGDKSKMDDDLLERHKSSYCNNKNIVFGLHGNYVTNPYSKRTLDEAKKLPIELRLSLRKMVEASVEHDPHNLPPEPDFKQLLKK